jgi:thiol-disulfide isomerase/thioredoxin
MKHYYQAAILFFLIVSTSTTADSTFDLSEFHGNVVLLDFWASWCVPCRRSFPWMNAMQEKYADNGLVIIAVNVDTDPAAANAFLEEYPAQFQVINDPDADLAREYGVVAMPSSYIFDRGGELITRHMGFKVKKQDEYEAILIEALNSGEERQ